MSFRPRKKLKLKNSRKIQDSSQKLPRNSRTWSKTTIYRIFLKICKYVDSCSEYFLYVVNGQFLSTLSMFYKKRFIRNACLIPGNIKKRWLVWSEKLRNAFLALYWAMFGANIWFKSTSRVIFPSYFEPMGFWMENSNWLKSMKFA